MRSSYEEWEASCTEISTDHEIFDAFANDAEYFWRPSGPVRDVALEAYLQYQHAHNPQPYPPPALYYRFEFGGVHFFALDVRSERWKRRDPQMIGGQHDLLGLESSLDAEFEQ